MKREQIIIIIFIICACIGLSWWGHKTAMLMQERNRYRRNSDALLSEVERYKVQDSLNAARVQSLELTLIEWERFQKEDAELIAKLKGRNSDLEAVNKTQSETIIELRSMPKDTLVLRDSILVPALAVSCGDAWYDFKGIMTDGDFRGTLRNRDSLVIVESVRYKRFLGFLWKTKRVRDRQLDAVSKNPHTTIMGVEYLKIEK